MSIRAHLATHLGDEVEAPIRLVFTKPQLGVRGEGILGCIQDSCHVVITTTRDLQHTPVEYTGYVNIAAGLGGCVCVWGGCSRRRPRTPRELNTNKPTEEPVGLIYALTF